MWETGPDYLASEDWNYGRSIIGIKQRMSPTVEENKEIDAEVKKKFKAAQINLSKVAPKDATTNFISSAQLKSNDLLKVQRTVLLCIEYLIKTTPKRLLTTKDDTNKKDDSPNCGGGENSEDFLGNVQSKMVCCTKSYRRRNSK